MLLVKGLWHPYAVGNNENGQVPNDINLGDDSTKCHPCALLMTGPNVGGKSTLMWATCLAVIFAQLGCYVPSKKKCILSPVDVNFTWLGATDMIVSGEITFFIECLETALVLRNATQDSLVLLDELGRGTTTFDLYAMASAFHHLVENVHYSFMENVNYITWHAPYIKGPMPLIATSRSSVLTSSLPVASALRLRPPTIVSPTAIGT